MKSRTKYFSKSVLSTVLALCMLFSCVMVGLVPTDAAQVESESIGATARTVYFTPYASGNDGGGWINDNKTIGARYNKKGDGGDWWDSQTGSDTGRTIGGKRVYSVTLYDEYGGLGNLYFRHDDLANNTDNEIHPFSSWTPQGTFSEKYWDGSSWATPSYDTFSVYNNGKKLKDLSFNSSTKKHTASVNLNAGTTYKLNVYDGKNYWANNDAGTITSSDSKDMYRYGSGGSGDGITITPSLSGTFTFTWTLSDKGSREDMGSLEVTFPTTYDINYTLGEHVSISSVTNGIDDGVDTITAVSGTDVALNVAYDSGYEFDSSTSTITGFTASNNNSTFTVNSISENKSIEINAKQSVFDVTVSAGTGGSITTPSGGSYTNLTYGSRKKIIASASIANNYVFSGWTASPAENITFEDAGAADTYFTATGAATITANFTQETLYPVTVKLDGSTPTTVNAGATIYRTLTRVDKSNEDYEFKEWTITGNVQIVDGYQLTDPTIQIKATGTGGVVTANYIHVDYIYFYAALQSDWASDPVVTVDGSVIPAYAWIAQKDNEDLPAKSIYSSTTVDSKIGGNDCYTYYIGIYRVSNEKVDKKISVYNVTDSNGLNGTIQNDQGRCYYTYSTSYGNNTYGSLDPQKVNEVTLNTDDYDADDTVTISKTHTVYYGPHTAGQDDFTFTYTLVNTSTNNKISLGDNLTSSTAQVTFVPTEKGITTTGTYKVVVTTKDSKTGKIINSCESSEFTIREVPTQSTVTFNGTNAAVSGSYKYKNGDDTSFTSGTSLRAGSVVTLTYTLNTGYTYNTSINQVIVSGVAAATITKTYDTSTNKLTVSFSVPSGGNAITVSYSATEIKHTVKLIKRYYKSNGTTLISTESSPYKTISAGIATAASTGDAPSVTDYDFMRFSLQSGVTKKTGDVNTSAAITVNATVDNGIVYADYKETLHTVTVQINNTERGKVSFNGTNISNNGTVQTGNITESTFAVSNNDGYAFDFWEIIPASGATVTVIDPNSVIATQTFSSATGATAPDDGNIRKLATIKLKTNGNATLKAHFRAVQYSISAVFYNNNTENGVSWYNNSISIRDDDDTTDVSDGEINDIFKVKVTLAPGYKIKSVSFVSGSGYMTPTIQSGSPSGTNPVVYRYKLNAGKVNMRITLEAVKPSLSVQLKGIDNNFEYVTLNSDGKTNVPHYYLQPDMAVATTDSFSTLTFENTNSSAIRTGVLSGVEVSLAAPSINLTSEGDTATYTFTCTAINDPGGVDSASTEIHCTVTVSFNNTQKVYFTLKKLMSRFDREDVQSNPYYKIDAPINAYNTAYDAAYDFVNGPYPVYNAGTSDYNSADEKKTNFTDALGKLKTYAKTTTVYILVNYDNEEPINVRVTTNGTEKDYSHFLMYSYGESSEKLVADNNSYAICKTTYYGNITKGTTNYYIYRFTFAGHAKLQVWRGNSATDTAMDNGERLSGVITVPSVYRDYYINLYNQTEGSTSVTSCSEYNPFSVIKNSGKKYVELNTTVSKDLLQDGDMFNFRGSGSFMTAPGGEINTSIKSYTIKGPIGKSGVAPKEYDLSSGDSVMLTTQGKYTVTCVMVFGEDAGGHDIEKPGTATLYVAFDDIDIYVDMNSNVGNPILNFAYKVGDDGMPDADGENTAYLPYEMELETGSESIYKYTIKMSKLRSDYNIDFLNGNPIIISYITVENKKIGEGTGFSIGVDARINGEVWLKADSTNLSTFNVISYSSITKSFLAVAENQATNVKPLASAFKTLQGTGVNTDDEEIYHSKYASLYVLDSDEAPMVNFNYVLKTAVTSELQVENNTYYFDKWVKFKTPSDGLKPDEQTGYLPEEFETLLADNPELETESTDINFTKAADYSEEGADYTYVALYKLVSSSDTTVRVEVTYNFEDYNTADGNYVYEDNKPTVSTSYTKTIKLKNTTMQAVKEDLDNIVKLNAPHVESNYFEYKYKTNSSNIVENGEIATESKLVVTANLENTARTYTIVFKDGDNDPVIYDDGKYQQTKQLSTSLPSDNIVWKMITYDTDGNSSYVIVGTGKTFNARFMTQGGISSDGNDCTIIKAESGSGEETIPNHSDIYYSFTETYYSGDTEMLRHNFYIIDYCAEGELKGGGVLFATTEKNGEYRKDNAKKVLDDYNGKTGLQNRTDFITGILKNDFDTEYKAQSINNVGFRYKPYKNTEDVFRYSDELHAYLTVFEGTNVNSPNYDGQKLRLFSFMVYDDNGTKVIVPSDGYAEVNRYKAG